MIPATLPPPPPPSQPPPARPASPWPVFWVASVAIFLVSLDTHDAVLGLRRAARRLSRRQRGRHVVGAQRLHGPLITA